MKTWLGSTSFFRDGDRNCRIVDASCLSPRVSRLLATDCTNDAIYLNVDGNCFAHVLSLGRGQPLEVTKDNCDGLWLVAQSLDNDELGEAIKGVDFGEDRDKLEISLSCVGMNSISQDEDRKFTFLVGDREYECGVLQACFLSPHVSQLLANGSSVGVLVLRPEDERCFRDVLALGRGRPLSINRGNCFAIESIAMTLGNEELMSLVRAFENLDSNSAVSASFRRLVEKNRSRLDTHEEVSFIAGHFYQLGMKSVMGLSVRDLESMLGNDELRLRSDNFLLEMIWSLMAKDEAYSSLFRYIHLEYIDRSHFDNYICKAFCYPLDMGMWICVREFLDRKRKEAEMDMTADSLVWGLDDYEVGEKLRVGPCSVFYEARHRRSCGDGSQWDFVAKFFRDPPENDARTMWLPCVLGLGKLNEKRA